jgi:hypothetical protein
MVTHHTPIYNTTPTHTMYHVETGGGGEFTSFKDALYFLGI